MAIYAELKEVHELRRFQLLKYPNNRLELRLEPMADVSREDAFEKACKALRAQLGIYGVENFDISLSEELPKQHPVSGKFKHIINVNENSSSNFCG